MEQILSRQRYFPESSSEPQIQTKCLAADILLLISNLETDAKCTIYLSKLKQDIEKSKNCNLIEREEPLVQVGNKVVPVVLQKQPS